MSDTRSLGLVFLAVAANLLVNQTIDGAHVIAGLGLVALLVLIARASRLTPAELGLARPTWMSGLRWGMASVVLVAVGYAVVLVVHPVRDAGQPAHSWAAALQAALITIPLGTVLPEELAFRGLLWSLLRRQHDELTATAVSSGLFGLWHVLPSLGGGAANSLVIDLVGDGAFGVTVRVVGTVLFTSAAGALFCWQRARSDSLLAPVLLHWAVNALGVVYLLLD